MTDGKVRPYALPARFQAPDAKMNERRSQLLHDLTTALLAGEADLSDYVEMFATHPADVQAHLDAFNRASAGDSRLPYLFLIDLLDRYPDGVLLWEGGVKGEPEEDYLIQTINNIGDNYTRARLRAKFGLTDKPSNLEDTTQDLIDDKFGWGAYLHAFASQTEDLQAHRVAFERLLNEYDVPENELKLGASFWDRMAELLIGYPEGPTILYPARASEQFQRFQTEIIRTLAALNDAGVNLRFGLAGQARPTTRTGSAPASRVAITRSPSLVR